MEFFITIYHTFLFNPIFNGLIILAETIPGKDFGVAIIVLTIGIRFASYPLGAKAIKAQKKFADLQPKIKEIKDKFKDKKEEQTRAMLALYKEAKINPFSSFAPFLIQIPIFIVLYQIFSHGLDTEQFSILYSFVETPEHINTSFFGIIDLDDRSLPLALGVGVLQFLQLRQMQPSAKKKKEKKQKDGKPDISSMMQTQMMYILPVVMAGVAATLPAAFGVYIATTTVFSIWQHWFISKRDKSEEEQSGAVQTA
jgi:YidC/Oxa1 family membrane protein insertase